MFFLPRHAMCVDVHEMPSHVIEVLVTPGLNVNPTLHVYTTTLPLLASTWSGVACDTIGTGSHRSPVGIKQQTTNNTHTHTHMVRVTTGGVNVWITNTRISRDVHLVNLQQLRTRRVWSSKQQLVIDCVLFFVTPGPETCEHISFGALWAFTMGLALPIFELEVDC